MMSPATVDDVSEAATLLRSFWPALDDATRVDCVRAMCIAGLTTAEIAEQVGVSEDMIVVLRIRHDIEPAYRRRDDIRLSLEMREMIAAMTLRGASDREIALAIGVKNRRTVARHRAAYNLPSPRKDIGLQLSVVIELLRLHSAGATQDEAAATLGINPSTVRRTFRRLEREWGYRNVGGRRDSALRTEVLRLAQAGSVPSAIAAAVGRSRAQISHLLGELLAAGLISEVRRSNRSRAEIAAIMRPIHERGGDLAEAAEALGCSRYYAGNLARRLGLRFPDGRLKEAKLSGHS